MKNKILSFILIALIAILSSITNVFASFADFTDEQADKQAEEQEKEHNITQIKSSDNYLTNIQIEGYTIVPEFDKQNLEYTIKEEIKESEINIKASASNEKAIINGTGKIKIEKEQEEHRIDVTAENGSVRTYIIKLSSNNKKEKKSEETVSDNIVESNIELDRAKEESEIKKNNTFDIKKYIIIGSIVAIILVLIMLFVKKDKKNGKRYK